jgi:release factor glutamine methyltransferase
MVTTLDELLQQGRDQLAGSSASPRLDAEILLGHVLKANRAHLYANPDRELDAAKASTYLALIAERAAGRPVAHLTGEREFWSLKLTVTADVLVPRPETELLVEQALRRLPTDAPSSALDLGCGSGAIAIALATERPACRVVATDRSDAALVIAKLNADRHCPGRIEFVAGSWFEPLAGQRFDVIASNPPYVASGRPDLTDRELDFEPAEALYSGADGLDDIRRIIAGARAHLVPGGWLLLEHGFDQSASIGALLQQAGFEAIATHNDLAGQPRVTEAQLQG